MSRASSRHSRTSSKENQNGEYNLRQLGSQYSRNISGVNISHKSLSFILTAQKNEEALDELVQCPGYITNILHWSFSQWLSFYFFRFKIEVEFVKLVKCQEYWWCQKKLLVVKSINDKFKFTSKWKKIGLNSMNRDKFQSSLITRDTPCGCDSVKWSIT